MVVIPAHQLIGFLTLDGLLAGDEAGAEEVTAVAGVEALGFGLLPSGELLDFSPVWDVLLHSAFALAASWERSKSWNKRRILRASAGTIGACERAGFLSEGAVLSARSLEGACFLGIGLLPAKELLLLLTATVSTVRLMRELLKEPSLKELHSLALTLL
jgi:hypothetical protein